MTTGFMRFLSLVVFLAASSICPNAHASPDDYAVQMHVKVPMRDGTRLDATVYRPVKQQGPLPVIIMLTPYPDYVGHPSGSYFAARGYIYASIDVRGRGDSDGTFDPFLYDARDGYDSVEWFARQPGSNGKVAMFGGSYAGSDQWLTASARPPHLVTIVPVASARGGVDFPFFDNIFENYAMQWLSFTSGKVLYLQTFADTDLWTGINDRLFLDKAAFSKLDGYAGNTTTVFQSWLQHPERDDYWRARGGTREQMAAIAIPVLEITGQHDGDQTAALTWHADHVSAAPGATAPTFTVIGPWGHAGTRQPTQDVDSEYIGPGNVANHYGPSSLLDVLRLQREWYDYTMKNGPLPAFLEKKLTYYVGGAGAECWKRANSFDTVSAKSLTLYLDASGGAGSLYHSGSLLPAQTDAHGGAWVSDPNDLSAATPTAAERSETLHGNGLIFHSAPFAEETELDGKMDLRAWLSIDAPDTDLIASLYLVDADGKVHPLNQTVLRARYRNGLDRPQAIEENKPEQYRLNVGWWFAARAQKGARLRLILGSLNDPSMEKNWNSMKPVAAQTGADARVAHIRLVQDAQHPSTLTVPLGDPKSPCTASADW